MEQKKFKFQKHDIFLNCVYMIFKHGKRFRFAPLFIHEILEFDICQIVIEYLLPTIFLQFFYLTDKTNDQITVVVKLEGFTKVMQQIALYVLGKLLLTHAYSQLRSFK